MNDRLGRYDQWEIDNKRYVKDSMVKMSYGCFNMNKLRYIQNKKSEKTKNPFENFYSFKKKSKTENRKSNIYFDVYKFIHKTNKKLSDPVEEINDLYKNLGLDDESLLDRANARDYKLYGNFEDKNYDYILGTHGNENFYNSLQYQRKSLYSRKSAIPDAYSDDMALRNKRIYKSNNNNNEFHKQIDYYTNQPSPTTADYLRTRLKKRATSLYNIVVKSAQDEELVQVLYDDMAYRNLRKDTNPIKKTNSINFNGFNRASIRV